ncbi:MAG: OsmC family protein [Gemmatimonadaceae bacterium]|nr:OsmC family protein [Gemmatimonadaceae bacterium]
MGFTRRSTAVWHGTGSEGKGRLTSTSGVLHDTPYSAAARFTGEDGKLGTNPEELIAAAHAGCFTMALSFRLAGAGFTPSELSTTAGVSIEKQGDGWSVVGIALELVGQVPGISAEQFQEIAMAAKEGCPISRALKAVPISITARLV